MNTTLSGSALLALSWFAGLTGSFADAFDRAPEASLVYELRAAGLIRPSLNSFEPTAKGVALLAEMAKPAPKAMPLVSYEQAMKRRVQLAGWGKWTDAEIDRYVAQCRAENPGHEVFVTRHKAGGVSGVYFERSAFPTSMTREEYRAECEKMIERYAAIGWTVCMPVEFS